jgi:fumarate reductase subunit C
MKLPTTHGPYRQSMRRWWRRDPFFTRYMLRECTAFAVAAYAAVLTWGLWALARGETAWLAWLAALRSPWMLALHALLLVAMVVHARSWFEIMPKTMPGLRLGGRRVSQRRITQLGWAAAGLTLALVLALTTAVGWR